MLANRAIAQGLRAPHEGDSQASWDELWVQQDQVLLNKQLAGR